MELTPAVCAVSCRVCADNIFAAAAKAQGGLQYWLWSMFSHIAIWNTIADCRVLTDHSVRLGWVPGPLEDLDFSTTIAWVKIIPNVLDKVSNAAPHLDDGYRPRGAPKDTSARTHLAIL